MASFFQKAKDRAQEAAAQFSSQYNNDSGGDGSTKTGSGFTYTGSLPHVFRQGMASVDPRFESTRSLHIMRGALKGVVIDGAALSRETKTAAAKTFKWGQDHAAQDRHDGVADEALADISDRLAYILTTLGDLELDHSRRLSQGRAELKQVQLAELEVANDRSQRIKIIKELQGLVAERQKPGGSARAEELQAQLTTLESNAQAREEEISKLKRQCFQKAFDQQMDSYIEMGQKLALVASYGKLLLQEVPVNAAAGFPAQKHHIGQGWEGSAKTAHIRSLVEPALASYKASTALPSLGVPDAASPAASVPAPTISDAASFRTSHAHELAQDAEDRDAGADTTGQAQNPFETQSLHSTMPLAPLPEGGSPNPNWNHSPSLIPTSTARPGYDRAGSSSSGAFLPPGHDQSSFASNLSSHARPSGEMSHREDSDAVEDTAPPGPTVAETGAILPSSPQGPGPKTGVLERRRPSNVAHTGEKPIVPPRPMPAGVTLSHGASHGGMGGPVGNTSPAVLPNISGTTGPQSVHARIRRDGTITRRGVDHDYDQAEAEQLPAYAELAGAEDSVRGDPK